jgi:peptidoglycan/LPS O-acetylase OafA/YrhL
MRFARIAPLLLLLTVLSALHFAQVTHFIVPAKTEGLGRALAAVLTFHVNVLEARRGFLPGSWDTFWSLSVEEMFYLFLPLTCRVLSRGNLLIALLAGFVVMSPLARAWSAHGNEVWREYSWEAWMQLLGDV